MRVMYLIREAFVNLRRNALIVVAAVLAVFLSLLLTFGAVVLAEVVRSNTDRWQDGIRLIAFLQPELSFDAIAAMREDVATWDGVEGVVYFTKADAFEEARELFKDQPALLEVIEEDPSFLPASLRIKPEDAEFYSVIGDRLAASPGVIEVQRADESIDRLRDTRRLLTQGSIGLALILGITAVALIANTIRMAIYSRREEIGIMKLVGAGNWFVRVPFLLEGMIEGIIGGALAVGLVFGTHQVVLDLQDRLPNIIDPEVPVEFLVRWGLVILVAGMAVGILGSGIALRRFLRE